MSPKCIHSTDEMPLYRDLTGFRLHCVAEGKRPQTTRWYEHKLRIFAQYLESQYAIDDEVEVLHNRAFFSWTV